MISLQNYTLTDKLHEGSSTLLYRGYRNSDRLPVAIKLTRAEHPSSRELAKFHHEYAVLRSLDLPGVVKAHALEKYGYGLALVLELVDGKALRRVLQERRLTLAEALRVTIAITEVLERIHGQRIIHRERFTPSKKAAWRFQELRGSSHGRWTGGDALPGQSRSLVLPSNDPPRPPRPATMQRHHTCCKDACTRGKITHYDLYQDPWAAAAGPRALHSA